MSEAIIDRISTALLMQRYGLTSRATINRWLDGLGIQSLKEGRQYYVAIDKIELCDLLASKINQGLTLNQALEEIDNGSRPALAITPQRDLEQSDTTSFIQLVHLISAALRTQANPLQHLECLERAVSHDWLLSTTEVKRLIGVKPYGNTYRRGSFAFIRDGKIGNQAAWQVQKIQ